MARNGWWLLCLAGCAGPAPRTSAPPAPTPAQTVAADDTPAAPPSAEPPPTASAVPAPPPSAEPAPVVDLSPAHAYFENTKLKMYRYHKKYIGGTEGFSAPIIALREGGFLVVGTRHDFPPGKYQVGKSRPVVAKLDASGKKLWERSYRKTGFLDFEGASAMQVDDDYIVFIQSYVHPARGATPRMVRMNADGEVLWDTHFPGTGRAHTPHPQWMRLVDDKLVLEGHIYKDSSETAYGWRGEVSLDGKILSAQIGKANPYR